MDKQLSQEIDLLYNQMCNALGDPTRLMIIYALKSHPRNVTELAGDLGIAQPTVSRHLKFLRDRYIVGTLRQGNAVYYSLADLRVIQALDLLRDMLRDRIREQAQLTEFQALESEILDEP
jgi:ArsR family transcriptional regulator